MADFGFIAAQAVDMEKTVRFPFASLRINGGVPFVNVRCASDDNQGLLTASVTLDASSLKKRFANAGKQEKKKLTPEVMAESVLENLNDQSERDLELYPHHVVTGWGIAYPTEDAAEIKEGVEPHEETGTFTGPMRDNEGVVEYTPEAGRKFLEAVRTRSSADWNGLRNFCQQEANFRPVIDAGEIAGN